MLLLHTDSFMLPLHAVAICLSLLPYRYYYVPICALSLLFYERVALILSGVAPLFRSLSPHLNRTPLICVPIAVFVVDALGLPLYLCNSYFLLLMLPLFAQQYCFNHTTKKLILFVVYVLVVFATAILFTAALFGFSSPCSVT